MLKEEWASYARRRALGRESGSPGLMLLPRRLNTLDPDSDMGISRSVRVSPPWYCFQYNR
jgi:hypothetical protein